MKFTLSWLKEHLETDATVAEIADALTDLGLEVEGVEDPADRLGAFTLGKVLEAEQHPDADRLRVCKVATDEGEKQIICGAPNARAGITVVIAKPGVYVPGIDTTISVGKIRGVESHGMMCSEREMELSDEHDGIIELPSGEVGDRFVDWLAANDPGKVDPVIEIAITPNRPDALGVEGVARDLAARGLGRVVTPPVEEIAGTFPCPVTVTIEPELLPRACPVFAGRLIRGVKNGPSPDWLQQRLKAIGLRPISALVDVTNYFTYDRNRPLHVFDADKVKGTGLRVHWAEAGSTLTALDDKEYTFESDMIMISDDHGPEAIAGVMGGAPTGCSEETVNVFIESAYWDPVMTASTGRRLKIHSDARYRFERGIDPASCVPGVHMATKLILDLCGGEPSDVVVAGAVPDTARSYPLRPERVSSLVGMDIAREDQVRILRDLGFTVNDSETITAHVPSWRPDVLGEADLVEEIARVTSLTKLVSQPLPRASGVGRKTLTPLQTRERNARRTLAALGCNECVTYSFIDGAHAALFGGGGDGLRLDNPISSEMSHMRPSPLPGLLAAAARNQAQGAMDLALFEVGAGYAGGEPGEQSSMAVALRVGGTTARHWAGTRNTVDPFHAKADAEAVLSALGVAADKAQIARQPGQDLPDWLHPGQSGALKLGPKVTLGLFGALHPKGAPGIRHQGAGGRHAGRSGKPAAAKGQRTGAPGAPCLEPAGGRA